MRTTILILLIGILTIFLAGCSSSSDPSDQETQLTKQQVDQIYEAQKPVIAALAGYMVSQSTNAASADLGSLQGGFGSGFFLKPDAASEKLQQGDFVYNGSGCWNLSYAESYQGNSIDLDFTVCFGTYDAMGYPTAANNTVSLSLDLLSSSSYSQDGYSSSSNIDESQDLNLSGVAGFNSGTGNLTVNGQHDLEYDFSYVTPEQSAGAEVVYSFTTTNVVLAPEGQYPLSGTFAFSISWTDTSPNSQQSSYTLSGTITFNGTSTVNVTFGGYNYTLNLDEVYYY